MTLVAERISFAYRPGRPVLRDVTLGLAPGSLTAIIGPNGAGKSTLLRILAGLLAPGEGSVALGGRPIGGIADRERSRLLAYIPQRPLMTFAFTVRQVVGLGRFAAARRPGATDAALDMVGLADRADEPFLALSAGQQQRAALARALCQLDLDRPGASGAIALLADEPVSAMDPLHALRTMERLRGAAARGLAVGVVLHDLTLAARYADFAAMLSGDGTLLAAGPAPEVLAPDVLARGYGVGFRRLTDPADGAVAMVPTGEADRVESGG